MKLSAGVEIIPKRDKVTYATNIFGRWEDYSIETYQGKVLKDAVDRFKIMLKEGKNLDSEVSSLKQLLSAEPEVASPEMKRIDFWDGPSVETEQSQGSKIEETKEAAEEVSKDKDLEDKIEYIDETDGPRYVIHAYVNKSTGRQMYLAGWGNNLDWMISAVPYACSRSKCEKLIEKAQKQIEISNKENRIRSRFPKDITFEIVEYDNPLDNEMSYEEIVKRANELLELSKSSKKEIKKQ